jgi:nicotinate-nucleotide adenylyltransferase
MALQQLGLDELRWLPAGAPWQKAGRLMADAGHRAAMLAVLLASEPRCVIDRRELERVGPTYTIDTVRELQAERSGVEWYLILGQDQYAQFHTWRDAPELLQRLTLAVAGRGGQAPRAPPALAGLPQRCVLLDMAPTDISATDIRTRIAAGQAVAALVGEHVASYIEQHQLYSL